MSNYSDSNYTEEGQNSSWHKVLNLVPENSTVLDIGCSSGNFGETLVKKKNCIVDGIELDQDDYKRASKKLRNMYNLNIETDSISDINERYDVIYFGDVIEHLVDPINALKKIKVLLKKDGMVLFSIPNMAHATIRLLMLKGDFEYTETGLLDKTHLHFYNLKEVTRVFESANFNLEKLDYVEKDYPDDLIKAKLAEYGLKITPKSTFLSSLRKIDSAAFQFIGVAKPTLKDKKPKKLKQFGPIDMFESFHNNTISSLKAEIDRLAKENNDLKAMAKNWQDMRSNPVTFVGKKIKSKLKNKN